MQTVCHMLGKYLIYAKCQMSNKVDRKCSVNMLNIFILPKGQRNANLRHTIFIFVSDADDQWTNEITYLALSEDIRN